MYISSETNFENITDEPFDVKKITWFLVKANLSETKVEIQEKKEAVKKQMAMGILQTNGLPAGLDPRLLGITDVKISASSDTNELSQEMFKNLRPQQKIQYLRQQQRNNMCRGIKPTQEKMLYDKFGLGRK